MDKKMMREDLERLKDEFEDFRSLMERWLDDFEANYLEEAQEND